MSKKTPLHGIHAELGASFTDFAGWPCRCATPPNWLSTTPYEPPPEPSTSPIWKEIQIMSLPSDLKYTRDHEWIGTDGELSTVGITAHAAEALGDVVYLDLPAVGTTIAVGDACGEIESTKSVSDLFAPADGEVVEINEAAVAAPGLVNTDPFGEGWLFRMRITGTPDLLDAAAYAALIEGA